MLVAILLSSALLTNVLSSASQGKMKNQSNPILLATALDNSSNNTTTECRFNFSSKTDKLAADVVTFNSTLDVYINAAQTLDNDISPVLAGLNTLDKVAKGLVLLDNALTDMNDLLEIAKAIPETKEDATKLSEDLAKIHPPVTNANTKVNKLNTKLTPMREKLTKLDKGLKAFIEKAKLFKTRLTAYSQFLSNAQQCLSSLPDGDKRNKLQSDIDNLADASDKRVVQATEALQKIITTINDIERAIKSKLVAAFDKLNDLEEKVEDLLSKINVIKNPLHDLHALYLKNFGFSFPYPSPTWKNPLRMKHCHVDIGFKTIIQGYNAIEKEIENILSGFLFKALKEFGLEKVIKGLIDDATSELNSITKRLNMNFKVEIPGLSDIDSPLQDLDTGFDDIGPKLDIDFQPLIDLMNQIESDINSMENIYKNCKNL